MKKIFEPVEIGRLHLKNRLVRSATWEALARPDGSIGEETYEIYRELARGGAGAVITGFTSVSSNDFYFEGMMRLSENRLIPQYRMLVDILHAEGCAALAQLALGAFYRPASGGIRQIEPDAMNVEEIRLVAGQFVSAACRAHQAGFDGVQLHVAHFFFLSRFVSPAVNHRADAYGGSVGNRARIILEIVDGIRREAPSLHITAKVNSSDFTPGGLEEAESLELCRILAHAGIDSMEVSGNGTSVAGVRPHHGEGYFAGFASRLASQVDTPVILVGGLRSLDVMEKLLDTTGIELLSLSRPLIREPDLPNLMRTGSVHESQCISCNRCYSTYAHKCIFRRG
ncbi:MAG: NADH:flavin oxidoreductase [Victivallales bacterium]|nr:NADH:flavin oxidoreductase [Victivallales bacterium]